MNVSELIEQLQKVNPDLPVCLIVYGKDGDGWAAAVEIDTFDRDEGLICVITDDNERAGGEET